jgi:hypothetical protein
MQGVSTKGNSGFLLVSQLLKGSLEILCSADFKSIDFNKVGTVSFFFVPFLSLSSLFFFAFSLLLSQLSSCSVLIRSTWTYTPTFNKCTIEDADGTTAAFDVLLIFPSYRILTSL